MAEPADIMQDPSQRARGIAAGVLRLLGAHDHRGLLEVPLANGRRADVLSIGPVGQISIIEIKSCLADYRADLKWPDYVPYCDQFYFAVAADFPQDQLPDETGLIVADPFGGAILREAPEHRLAPARRKALTLRFARLAATRLYP